MGEIETRREDIRKLEGVHVFHFPMSNCSQRVRMTATEKGIAWTSHIVDLTRDEHHTPGYLALNPKGLVPVLVHDGRTFIESNDIIAYLDDAFPDPPLMPEAAADRDFVRQAIESANGAQGAIKLLSHEFLFKPKALKSPKALEAFAAQCQDKALLDFHREFTAGKGFSAERIRAALQDINARFEVLEQRLGARPWLSGETYGLADISWIVNAHRLDLMAFPFAPYPRLKTWLKQAKARASFAAGIRAFEAGSLRVLFATYTQYRHLRRTAAKHYL